MRRHRPLLTAVLLAIMPLAYAGLDEGVDATKKGDYQTALREWAPLAEQGDARAQSLMGLLYANGLGVPQDEAQAVQWTRKAADQGLDEAQNNLGVMYEKGLGVPRDDAEAVQWYRKAAEQGHAKAQNNLAAMYGNGQGVAPNRVIANALFNVARANGCKESAENLAKSEALMGTEEVARAQQLSREMLKPGNLLAALDKYQKNIKKKPQNANPQPIAPHHLSINELVASAQRGGAKEQLNAGLAYYQGWNGIKYDNDKAIYWFTKAAANGSVDAEYFLGLVFCAQKHNTGMAKYWFNKAAMDGSLDGLMLRDSECDR